MGAQTLAATLDGVKAWVESAIAPQLEYLVPPDDGAVDNIDLVWAHPSVYQSFVPSVERLKGGMHQAPSICVRFLGGHDAKHNTREITIRLLLTIWSPGHFISEQPEPNDQDEPVPPEPATFVRDSDGWRDLFNGLGVIADAIETAEVIANCSVDMNEGVHYGFYEIDNEIPDMYPYWMGQVDFRLLRAPQANKRFNDML